MNSLFILSERQIQKLNPFELPSKPYTERKRLPNVPAVYFLLSSDEVVYIGQSISLVLRWSSHNLVGHISSLGWDPRSLKISYFHCPETWLDAVESRMIDRFRPSLNSSFPRIDLLPEVAAVLSEIEAEADGLHKQLKRLEADKYNVKILKAKVSQDLEELRTDMNSISEAVEVVDNYKSKVKESFDRLQLDMASGNRVCRDSFLGSLLDAGFMDPEKQSKDMNLLLEPVRALVLQKEKERSEVFDAFTNDITRIRKQDLNKLLTAIAAASRYFGGKSEELLMAFKQEIASHNND